MKVDSVIKAFALRWLGLFLFGAVFVAAPPAFAQTRGPTYACVSRNRNPSANSWFRIITAGQSCRTGEVRMIVVASKTLPIIADTSTQTGSSRTGNPILSSTAMPTDLSTPSGGPLVIAIRLQLNTDKGMYTIPAASRSGTPSPLGVSCAPMLDGRRGEPPKGLSTNAAAVGQYNDTGMVNPLTGQLGNFSSGHFPYTVWSILRSYQNTSPGQHTVALTCQASSAFHFGGMATVTALQPD